MCVAALRVTLFCLCALVVTSSMPVEPNVFVSLRLLWSARDRTQKGKRRIRWRSSKQLHGSYRFLTRLLSSHSLTLTASPTILRTRDCRGQGHDDLGRHHVSAGSLTYGFRTLTSVQISGAHVLVCPRRAKDGTLSSPRYTGLGTFCLYLLRLVSNTGLLRCVHDR